MIGKLGIELLKHFEGLRMEAYQDSVGIWTIGYGTTIYQAGGKVREGDQLSDIDQAVTLMQNDMKKVEAVINKSVVVALDQCQFDALCCFTYNVGGSAFSSSTLLKKINSKASQVEIGAEFLKWCHGGGNVIQGLLNRRMSEAYLYFNGKNNF